MSSHTLPSTGSHSCALSAWAAWNEKRAVSSLGFMALNQSAFTHLLLSDSLHPWRTVLGAPVPSRKSKPWDRAGTAAPCPGPGDRTPVRCLMPGKVSKQGSCASGDTPGIQRGLGGTAAHLLHPSGAFCWAHHVTAVTATRWIHGFCPLEPRVSPEKSTTSADFCLKTSPQCTQAHYDVGTRDVTRSQHLL